MQDGLGRQAGAGRILVASGARAFDRDDAAQFVNISGGDLRSDALPKDGQDVIIEQHLACLGADTMIPDPETVVLRQLAEGDLLYAGTGGSLFRSDASAFRHGPLLFKRLRRSAQADVLLQLTQQGDGFLESPTVGSPAESLELSLALSAPVADGDVTIRTPAVLACGMLSVDDPFFAGTIDPSLLLACTELVIGAHMVPTFIVLQGMLWNQTVAKKAIFQVVKYPEECMGYSTDFLLSSRLQVRFLPGAPNKINGIPAKTVSHFFWLCDHFATILRAAANKFAAVSSHAQLESFCHET